jgi:hypothetical protein
MAKRYSVTIPRPYKDANGNEKTHFWHVGTAFPLRERDGLSVKLYSKMLVTDQFVLFADEEDQPASAPEEKPDDLPF